MRRELVVPMAMALVMAAAPMAMADRNNARRDRDEAPRLLKEAVRTGTAEMSDFAAIADWILHEKEERVAAGLAEVLGALDPAIAGAAGERWNGTTRAMLSLFTRVLRDAERNRHGSDAFEAELAALVSTAAPAVAAALREADPEAKKRIAELMDTLGPLSDELAPLLGADLAAAAREALKETGTK